MTPYKYWDSSIDYLVIDGEVFINLIIISLIGSRNIFKRYNKGIYLKGFDIFIKPTFNSTKEYSNDAIMTLRLTKTGIKFIVCLKGKMILM